MLCGFGQQIADIVRSFRQVSKVDDDVVVDIVETLCILS